MGLVGTKAKLTLYNVSILNFNSFSKHITLISLMALISEVEIVNMSIDQAYLAKSIISSDQKSIFINISIANFQIKKLNFFQVINSFFKN